MESSPREDELGLQSTGTSTDHSNQQSSASAAEELISRICDEFIESFRNPTRAYRSVPGSESTGPSRDAMIESLVAAHPEVGESLRKALHSVKALLAISDLVVPAAGTSLGDFLLRRLVARGGMGVVYEAEQLSMRRRVALKILVGSGQSATREDAQLIRFQNEVRASATLDHPSIVPIYSVGQVGCYHFYAMRWIEGIDWQSWMNSYSPDESSGNLSGSSGRALGSQVPCAYSRPVTMTELRRVVAMVRDIADGLKHAHERGVIHRDIKPANLLLDVHGHVWITDFGLAHFPTATSMTQTGELVGTLRYMSPEQAGGSKRVDERSDIFSLGATFYELLLGRPFVDSDDRKEKLRRIITGELPRSLDGVPHALETIVLNMTAFELSDRYQSAADVVADLERWLANRPIHAKRLSWRQRAVRWSRVRAGWLLTLSTALIVSVVALGILSGMLARSREKLRDGLVASHLAEARALLKSAQPGQRFEALKSIAMAVKTGGLHPGSEVWLETQALTATAGSLRDIESIRSFDRHSGGSLDSAVFSPDLQLYTIYDPPRGQVVVDTQTTQEIAALVMKTPPMTVSFTKDNKHLCILREPESDAVLEMWPFDKTREQWSKSGRELGSTICRYAIDLSAVDHLVAVGLNDGRVAVLEATTGELQRELIGPACRVGQVHFSPSGRWVAATFPEHRVVQIWDTRTGLPIADWKLEEDSFALAWSADESSIAFGDGFSVNVYACPDWSQRLARLSGPTEIVANIYFHPEGKWLAVYGYDGKTRFWDVASQRLVLAANGHAQYFGADGSTLAYRTYDSIGIWQFSFDDVVWHEASPFIRTSSPVCVEFVAADRVLVTGGYDGCLFWDVASHSLRHIVRCGPVNDLCYESSLERLFVATDSGLLAIQTSHLAVQPANGQPIGELLPATKLSLPEGESPSMVDYSAATGDLLASTQSGGVGVLNEQGSWNWLHEPGKRFSFVALSEDGRWAYGSENNDVLSYLWDLSSPHLQRWEIVSPEGGAATMTEHEGRQLLLTSEQTRYRGWELIHGQPPRHLYDLQRPSGYQKSVVSSSSSLGWLVAVDRTRLRVCALENANLKLELSDGYQIARIHDIAGDSQGRRVAVACADDGFLVWDLVKLDGLRPK